jgi:nucleotide-binding universal stress UspA family protein
VTVVVGYDGHPRSDAALDHAIAAARDAHEKLLVLAVFELPLDPEGPRNYGTYDDSAPATGPVAEPPELEPVFARARARVEAGAGKADYVWAVGEPGDAIVETARDRNASLVVVGAHEHSFFGRLLGSDVAEEVRGRVDCEVVAV